MSHDVLEDEPGDGCGADYQRMTITLVMMRRMMAVMMVMMVAVRLRAIMPVMMITIYGGNADNGGDAD